ncbi:suppressor of fused domain protein [Pseudomonas stutzeri]|uniref:suppressor of fused domain protein n=1 Tax=Stutzerimonas stutzeri TaxID=316 RepID=UPI00210DA531|nr:suppressor of fused domain protein [Stutzerimonas stutzeri]MCQ4298070.1 suppressor of fused domain protein [Stutzerimonas stutzeri]
MNIIAHAERFLGKASQGWNETGSVDGLQVLYFENAPLKDISTYITVGLSFHELKINEKKNVRQELIFAVSSLTPSETVASLLLYVCELVLSTHEAIFRGQLIEMPIEAAEKLGFDALYCTIPVFLHDHFATYHGSVPATVFVWMIPVCRSEANYIEVNGWSAFEDLLEDQDPDLFLLERDPIV